MEYEEFDMDIDVPASINILGKHVYPSITSSLIRESIQNSHDSCIRRKVEDSQNFFLPEIRITTSYEPDRVLKISDNGSGLDEAEIHNYLSTIGNGYTRYLREKENSEDAKYLVGNFGIGKLSVFGASEKIEIITRSFKEDEGIFYQSFGDGFYTIEKREKEDIGSELIIYLKPQFEYLLMEDVLAKIIKKYCCFLKTPILLNDKVINNGNQPWNEEDSTEEDYHNFSCEFMKIEPIGIIPLNNQELDIKGMLVIPEYSLSSSREYGSLQVFVRDMHISSNEKNLLSEWAKFVTGVINSNSFSLTASRESIKKDEYFAKICSYLEEQILNWFKKIKSEDPSLLKKVMENHAGLINNWSLIDPDFFNQIKDFMIFNLDQRKITLTEYVEQYGNTIYFENIYEKNIDSEFLEKFIGVEVIKIKYKYEEFFINDFVEYSEKNIKAKKINNAINDFIFEENNESDFSDFKRIKDLLKERKNIDFVLLALSDYESPFVFISNKENNRYFGFAPDEFSDPSDEDSPVAVDKIIINTENEIIKAINQIQDTKKINQCLDLIISISERLNRRIHKNKNYAFDLNKLLIQLL